MLWQLACTMIGAVVAARGGSARKRKHADLPWIAGGASSNGVGKHNGRSKQALENVAARNRTASSFSYAVVKRVVDVALIASCVVVAAPLMGAIAVGLGLTLGRPIFFSQQRLGRGGRRFRLYKFRTLDNRPLERSETEWFTPAAHPFASLLRRTGLDELPQLVNVLRGEMSLVGPRPERPHFAALFEQQLPRYAARHQLRPGITGWAQVSGLRGDTSISQRLEHDLFYLEHWSLAFDLRILALTVCGCAASLWTLLRGKPDPHAGIV